MVMTDPIADMLTRVRNALKAKHETVRMPASKMKGEILRIMKEEGFIEDFEKYCEEGSACEMFSVKLKYFGGLKKQSVIAGLRRVSRPGLRIYTQKDQIPRVNDGLGLAVISTSKGVMTDKQSRKYGIGGEIVCYIW